MVQEMRPLVTCQKPAFRKLIMGLSEVTPIIKKFSSPFLINAFNFYGYFMKSGYILSSLAAFLCYTSTRFNAGYTSSGVNWSANFKFSTA
jgi:hypothetical protein